MFYAFSLNFPPPPPPPPPPDVSLIKPDDSFNPLFKAIVYSVLWVRKLANT